MPYAVNHVVDNWEFYSMLAGSVAAIQFVIWAAEKYGAQSMKQETIDLLTEEFTSSIEDRVADGKISRTDATEAYRRLKQLFPTRELYPSVEWLKDCIRRRRAYHIHDPVPLPSEEVKGRNLFERPYKHKG